jgi:hypothetical protein
MREPQVSVAIAGWWGPDNWASHAQVWALEQAWPLAPGDIVRAGETESIPQAYWDAFLAALRQRGLELDDHPDGWVVVQTADLPAIGAGWPTAQGAVKYAESNRSVQGGRRAAPSQA